MHKHSLCRKDVLRFVARTCHHLESGKGREPTLSSVYLRGYPADTTASVRAQLVRRWQSGVCQQGLLAEAAPPLFCHHAAVRTLAAGPAHTLVSGDKRGDVAVWRI